MQRRDFFRRTGVALGAVPVLGTISLAPPPAPTASSFDPTDWASVRDQFPLTRSRIHLASFLLASHPQPVAEAIERHRRGFDEDPATYWYEHVGWAERAQRAAIGEYLHADPHHIALTDSTTMGLGLIYGTLKLRPGQEILTTPHDHYSTETALRYRAERTGATVRRVALYDDPAQTSVDEVVARMLGAITDRTRVLAVTWVHSSTGVKLPIGAMAQALAEVNARRDEADRVLLCADAVHGLGIDDVTVDDLGCDFLMAGTHKWMFGPRGTGLIWGRPHAWAAVDPVIPTFSSGIDIGSRFTPGGFHSFEHRWAVGEAFRFHLAIGKDRIQERIHGLNTLAKEALAELPHVHLHTPMSPSLSGGIICFEVDGYTPHQVVRHLHDRGIIASVSPYRVSYARLAPSLINNDDEVLRAVAAIAALG
ncbi:MAG: aminotransferase class V-fold PLP-dependent enzyme [Rhodothermaceae bacterium]|nr:aminotransferase class V-fold PLP-dependent enzyme [Rhodothermaceae bacterium]